MCMQLHKKKKLNSGVKTAGYRRYTVLLKQIPIYSKRIAGDKQGIRGKRRVLKEGDSQSMSPHRIDDPLFSRASLSL